MTIYEVHTCTSIDRSYFMLHNTLGGYGPRAHYKIIHPNMILYSSMIIISSNTTAFKLPSWVTLKEEISPETLWWPQRMATYIICRKSGIYSVIQLQQTVCKHTHTVLHMHTLHHTMKQRTTVYVYHTRSDLLIHPGFREHLVPPECEASMQVHVKAPLAPRNTPLPTHGYEVIKDAFNNMALYMYMHAYGDAPHHYYRSTFIVPDLLSGQQS